MPGPRSNAAQPYIVTGLSLLLTAVIMCVGNPPAFWSGQ